jgi:hypothetical protein
MNPTLPEICFLLGFLYADGYILYNNKRSEIRIQCVEDDINNLRNIFDISGKWGFCLRKSKPTNKMKFPKNRIQVYVSDKETVKFLVDKGYKNKSSKHIILDAIPIELKRYWLWGLICGDGCFTNSKTSRRFSISSSYNQDWSYIERIFSSLNIKFNIRKDFGNKHKGGSSGKCSLISISNKDGIIKLYDYLFPNGFEFGLKRKYDKANKCISAKFLSKQIQ